MSRKSRVAFPYLGADHGGSYRSGILLAKDLPKSYEPVILFPHEGAASKLAEEYDLNYEILDLPSDKAYGLQTAGRASLVYQIFEGVKWLPQVAGFRKYLIANEFDIVHTNDSRTTLIWGLAANLCNIPLVWHVRKEYSSKFWDTLRILMADYAICVSRSTANELGPFPHLINSKVLYNGVDLSRFDVQSGHLQILIDADPESQIIGFIGNMTERKRPLLFAKAVINILKNRENTHAVMIGSDKNGYTEQIRMLAENRGVKSYFHLLGYRDDIEFLLRDIDCLVLTSAQKGEAFPRVIIEAMASGTPVVATDVAGVSEAISHNKTGMIVPNDIHPNKLSKNILALLNNPSKLQDFSTGAKEYAENTFCNRNISHEVSKIYDSLIHS